jgi:glycerophosphoryl diester phosphodiesterase
MPPVLVMSHRGWWTSLHERNSLDAIARSAEAGFGTETDLRDRDGRIVVSHDPPDASAPAFLDIARAAPALGQELPFALNVKADGLAPMIAAWLRDGILGPNAFAFDMSIPDALAYRDAGIPFYTRQSEYESAPSLYAEAVGVWLDCFESAWYDEALVTEHLTAGKKVCLVSPELHGRDPRLDWEAWSAWDVGGSDSLLLCTDFPDDAQATFAR